MYLEALDFVRDLLSKSPAVGLITWTKQEALAGALAKVCQAVRNQSSAKLVHIVGGELDSPGFESRLREVLSSKHARKTFLLVDQIEPLVSAAGRVMNGYREEIATVLALVVAIRRDRQRE